MEAIVSGATGAAVEDIQERLCHKGFEITADERENRVFGPSTQRAVMKFRMDYDLPLGTEVDSATWSVLVDETYELGDRTLYLRLPNFKGNDVRQLQDRLEILGFGCGEVDGKFGAHTEAAVKLFQESVGLLPDGMAFQDTFDAIERLRHVWSGKHADGPHPSNRGGFARAASVLEQVPLAITAEDPISRNVAGRIFNLADATTTASALQLIDSAHAPAPGARYILVLASTHTPLPVVASEYHTANVLMDDLDTLPQRLRTAVANAQESTAGLESESDQDAQSRVAIVRIELPVGDAMGNFTVSDAQTYAVLLLDAICSAFDAS